MPVFVTVCILGIERQVEYNLGDIVLTYDGRIAQIREIDYLRINAKLDASIKLNTGEWVDVSELERVKRLGYRANLIMKERGLSRL